MARVHVRIPIALTLALAGCGSDRGDDALTGTSASASDTAGDDAGEGGTTGLDDGGATDGTDDGAADTAADETTGDTGAADDGGPPPGECPPSGKAAPTGCWSMGADWDDVRCGCGPSLGSVGSPSGSAEDISACSGYADVGGLFAEINMIRDQYVDSGYTLCHSRFKGIPWEGENAGMTWPSYFTWDDCLAAKAQELAEQIAAGTASHGGTRVAGQNGGAADFYMDNMFAADFRITFDEQTGEHEAGRFALSQSNGSARMGLFYADFDGDGPVIQQLGIGASVGANCKVTWVLQFGT